MWEFEETEEETDSLDESLASEITEEEPSTNTVQTEASTDMRARGAYGGGARGGYGYAEFVEEPNSHIFIEHLVKYFDSLKFIFVVRNGLDMALSRNQKQFENLSDTVTALK